MVYNFGDCITHGRGMPMPIMPIGLAWVWVWLDLTCEGRADDGWNLGHHSLDLTLSLPEGISHYTLSHLENDCDVSAHSRGKRLSMRAQLVCILARSKRNNRIYAFRMRLAACILRRAKKRHGRSRDETKYSICVHAYYAVLLISCWMLMVSVYIHVYTRRASGVSSHQ